MAPPVIIALAHFRYGAVHSARLLLLKHNAIMDFKDQDGRTPLHWACTNPSIDCLAIMLSRSGLQLLVADERDCDGMTAVMWAAHHNYPNHVKRLLDFGANAVLMDNSGKSALHWVLNGRILTKRALICRLVFIRPTDFSVCACILFRPIGTA